MVKQMANPGLRSREMRVRRFTMCDCISSSTPVTYPSIRTQKSVLLRCNSRLNTHGIELFRLNVARRNPAKASNFCNSVRLKSWVKVSSKNYELSNELGFEEKPQKVSNKSENLSKDGDVDKVYVNSTTPEGGIEFVDEKKEVKRTSEGLGSSSFDFLELENDLENKKKSNESLGSLDEEELLGVEGLDRVELGNEELRKFDGKQELRRRRQLMWRSNMLAKQVISVQSALSLGFVSQLWVDTSSWVVVVVEVRPSLLSGEIERFLLEEVYQVGDVVLVQDENVMENGLQMVGLDTLVGYNVITPRRRNIGKVRGYTFDINSGSLESLELDSFGVSMIPSSLVSTYALFVEDVIEVAFDTVMVHEAAASRLQRLTKGFWDTRSMETSDDDEFEDYSDIERRSAQLDDNPSSQKSFRRNKFSSKKGESKDKWDLPMDYL